MVQDILLLLLLPAEFWAQTATQVPAPDKHPIGWSSLQMVQLVGPRPFSVENDSYSQQERQSNNM
ncbi:hypothetical protein NQZ68_014343 [Dissostichus eleginoides]|nr:hypothetical protein NQZ68_014343 [Dissostichus eleginoides]